MLAFTYILIGVFFSFHQKEPVEQSREDQSVFMFYLLGWVILWPLFLLNKLIKGK